MKIPALSTMFLAGSLSLVAAAPVDNETTERIRYTDAAPRPASEARLRTGWVEIASPTPCSHGREYITADGGRYTRLRLDVASGRPTVQTVRVDFTNGKSQFFRLDTTLDPKVRRSVYVDFHGARSIDQIVVTTPRDAKGAYTVHAETASDGIALR